MSHNGITNYALKLMPKEHIVVVESLLQSLDKTVKMLDKIWPEEAQSRLKAYREQRLKGEHMEALFNKESDTGSSRKA